MKNAFDAALKGDTQARNEWIAMAEKCFSDDETIVPSGTIVPTPQSNIKPAYNKNN